MSLFSYNLRKLTLTAAFLYGFAGMAGSVAAGEGETYSIHIKPLTTIQKEGAGVTTPGAIEMSVEPALIGDQAITLQYVIEESPSEFQSVLHPRGSLVEDVQFTSSNSTVFMPVEVTPNPISEGNIEAAAYVFRLGPTIGVDVANVEFAYPHESGGEVLPEGQAVVVAYLSDSSAPAKVQVETTTQLSEEPYFIEHSFTLTHYPSAHDVTFAVTPAVEGAALEDVLDGGHLDPQGNPRPIHRILYPQFNELFTTARVNLLSTYTEGATVVSYIDLTETDYILQFYGVPYTQFVDENGEIIGDGTTVTSSRNLTEADIYGFTGVLVR